MIERVTDINAVPEDDLKALGEGFVREARVPGGFKVDVFKRNWSMILGRNMGAMWIIRNGKIQGALGAIMHPDINDDQPVAQETFWFVAPEYRGGTMGIRLLNEFETWAAFHGAKRIISAHLTTSMPEKVARVFQRRGYYPAETVHIKVL